MSELNKQLTITSVFDLGEGNRILLRGRIAEYLKSVNSPVAAFRIETVRLVSYGLKDGKRSTMIPGTGVLETAQEGRASSMIYHLNDVDDVSLTLQYVPATQSVKVDRTANVVGIELAVTISPQDFKPSPDGYLYITIPVSEAFRKGRNEHRGIVIDHGSFQDDGDLVKGTWAMEYGAFEPAFDSAGNIIAFNLVNKP